MGNNYGYISDEEVLNFINSVINYENSFLQKNYDYTNLKKYFTIKSREANKIVVHSSYNTGLSKNNTFYLTMTEFKSLYRLCSNIKDQDLHTKAWLRVIKVKNVRSLALRESQQNNYVERNF